MIEGNKLRLGNWVITPYGVKQVRGIDWETVGFDALEVKSELLSLSTSYSSNHSFSELEPIPITFEEIERFGLEKVIEKGDIVGFWIEIQSSKDELGLKNETSDVIVISWSNDGGFAMSLGRVITYLPHIKHVHQLQNLYFVLTGNELT